MASATVQVSMLHDIMISCPVDEHLILFMLHLVLTCRLRFCVMVGEQEACTDNTTNILYSKSPDGPWQQLNAPFVKSATMGTAFAIDNPTVTFFPNGSLLMLGRGGDPARQASSDGVITAANWRGPYVMHDVVGNTSSPSVR